jgi:glutathione S-transferase
MREKGLMDTTDEIIVIPVENPKALVDANPLAQIPTLVLPNGESLTDSIVIAHYLDEVVMEAPKLYPKDDGYWPLRRLEMLGSGMLEMMVKMVLERRRPENEQSPMWLSRWHDNLMRSLDVAEQKADAFGDGTILNGANLTLAIALSYIDFRYPLVEWKNTHPKVAKMQSIIEMRQSFIDTYPK